MITVGWKKARLAGGRIAGGGRRAAVGAVMAAGLEEGLVIRLPEFHVLRLVARSLLALALISFPMLSISPQRAPITAAAVAVATGSVPKKLIDDAFFLPMLFRDLKRHGLYRPGDRAMFLGGTAGPRLSRILRQNRMELVAGCEGGGGCRDPIADGTLDFVFSDVGVFRNAEFVDRLLKVGGVAVLRLNSDRAGDYRMASNYKIVYIRRFNSMVVAMRKVAKQTQTTMIKGRGRRLLAVPDSRKEALNNLEDVLLEPPRFSGSERMSPVKYLERTKYLSDLMGDTLDNYPRRVFVEVVTGPRRKGGAAGAVEWLARNYSNRNRAFEIIRVEVEAGTTTAEGASVEEDEEMSGWLRRNVREEEYVVMKAEAGVVEDMVRSGTVALVDELFLQCRHGAGETREKGDASGLRRRAYWECLALYGKLRDAGVAVHQWWWD